MGVWIALTRDALPLRPSGVTANVTTAKPVAGAKRATPQNAKGWGCSDPVDALGLCPKHLRQHRKATADPCSIEGCGKPVHGFGFCTTHYGRFNRHGDPLAWKKPSRQVCTVEDCNLKQAAHGLCDTHYRRQKRYGTTDLPQKPPVKPMPPFKCRLCGVDLPKTEKGRLGYCSKECREGFQYWERKRTHRERWLKHRFGLTVEQYEAMVEVQGGKCAICFTTEPSSHKGRHWCIDHDHKTGKVRGLLCANCNSGLGQLKDDPDVLRRAIEYLG